MGCRKCLVGVVVAAFVFLGLGVGFYLEKLDVDAAVRVQREHVLDEAGLLATRLQAEVDSTFFLIAGLSSHIGMHPYLSREEYSMLGEALLKARPGLRNIAAAPDMVVRYIYPEEGNEAVLGLNYRTHEGQREAAMRVMETGKPVIAGPLTLVQGGEAIIGRFPVFVLNRSKENKFWGIISTPVDTQVLYKDSGLNDPSLEIAVALRGKDSLGAEGEVFFGEGDLFENNPVLVTIPLVSGSWQMAAEPKGGWMTAAPNRGKIWSVVILVTGAAILIIVLLYFYLRRVEEAREVEVRANQIKTRFLENMSHEIRTPLNGILGGAHYLQETAGDDDDREMADIILNSSKVLNNLLNDILELSRIETEVNAPVDLEPIDLEVFLEELFGIVRMETKEKELEFKFSGLPGSLHEIVCEAVSLRQILWNLLNNAVKFTESGRIGFTVEERDAGPGKPKRIVFKVKDSGVGIPKDRQKVIFDEFTQVDESLTKKYSGAGVGLSIVKRLVKRLGGEITVESEEGKGSCFCVALPLRQRMEQHYEI